MMCVHKIVLRVFKCTFSFSAQLVGLRTVPIHRLNEFEYKKTNRSNARCTVTDFWQDMTSTMQSVETNNQDRQRKPGKVSWPMRQ